jgi:prepilin-type N-terminal cleavage/methylation domain-containing protein
MSTTPSSGAARRDSGFTLLELLVALVISGVLVSGVWQLFVMTSSAVRLQGEMEEVQQNARAALEIIAGDLRATSSGAWRIAAADSIAIRLPVQWGLMCDSTISSGSSSIRILLPNVPLVTSTPGGAMGMAMDTSLADTPWYFVGTVVAGDSTTLGTFSSCSMMSPSGSLLTRRMDRTSGSFPSAIVRGRRTFLYEVVRYSEGTSTRPGRWLRRNGLMLTGPVPPGEGLKLRYFNGSKELLPPIVDQVILQSITHVELTLVTLSSGRGGTPLRRTTSTVVYLRN